MWDWLSDDQDILPLNMPITQVMVNLEIKGACFYMGTPPTESCNCLRGLIKFSVPLS